MPTDKLLEEIAGNLSMIVERLERLERGLAELRRGPLSWLEEISGGINRLADAVESMKPEED
jgi:uncharacterized protein (UPF0335 family)